VKSSLSSGERRCFYRKAITCVILVELAMREPGVSQWR